MDVGGNVNEYSQVIIWWEGNINCKILFSWIVHDNGFQQHSWCMKEWTQRQGTYWLGYLAIWVRCCSGWTEAFTVVVAGDEVINGKPAPDMWGFYPCCELPNHLSIITEMSQHLDCGFWFSSFALQGWIALSLPVLCWWSLWATWQISGSCKAVECRPSHMPCHWRCSVSLYYSHFVLCHRLLFTPDLYVKCTNFAAMLFCCPGSYRNIRKKKKESGSYVDNWWVVFWIFRSANNVSELLHRAGVKAGKAAGMTVLAVPSLPTKEFHSLYSDADVVLNSLLDLEPETWGLPPFEDRKQPFIASDPSLHCPFSLKLLRNFFEGLTLQTWN